MNQVNQPDCTALIRHTDKPATGNYPEKIRMLYLETPLVRHKNGKRAKRRLFPRFLDLLRRHKEIMDEPTAIVEVRQPKSGEPNDPDKLPPPSND